MAIKKHLASIESISEYKIILEFTKRMDPSTISGNGLSFVSMRNEIDANSLLEEARELHKKCGRIPYGSPLYVWETHKNNKWQIAYIGQTMEQKIQKRFEGHSNLVKLLAKNVNDHKSKVFYRLCSRFDCSRFDLIYCYKNGTHTRRAIEHLPLDQARKVVNDIEAKLIYQYQPEYNTLYKKKEKKYWKKFNIEEIKWRNN